MATQLLVGQVLRLRVACYTPSQVGVNTVHYLVTLVNGSGQTDVTAATTIDGIVAPLYKLLMSAGANYRGVSLQKIFPGPVSAPALVVASDGAGSVAGDMMPGQVSGIISSATALAGPAQRGRVYIPFPSETDSDVSGTPITTYVTRLTNLGSKLFSAWSIGSAPNQVTLSPVVWHRVLNTTDGITNFTSRQRWATQRRRGAYGKYNAVPF